MYITDKLFSFEESTIGTPDTDQFSAFFYQFLYCSLTYDFTSLNLDENRLIADWESGIIDTQIENFTKSLKAGTSAQPYLLTCSSDMIALYDLGSYLSVHYIEKNKSLLSI